MSSERLGASFSIDVTQLKAGLTQANRLIRESNSEFKAAAAGMNDWTKSEAGLNAKLKNLNSVADLQRTKVSAMQKEYDRLISEGLDPASAAAVKYRTDLNNEQAALNKTEADIEKYKAALKDAGKDAEDAGEKANKSGDDAEKGGKGWQKFGNAAKAAAKAAAAAAAAAGAAIVGVAKQAIENFAEYEQLVGGVETLFKNSSDEVLKYAQNAYKTAGMSANEYMETVTSFSASLLQSLGGDTKKAAKAADQAVTDMSDNANKMGTDIEMLQNAYGGFAKGNFTMLDNLKLGYGGTKEEMERLLKDAQKISGVKYDISSFADISEAIHVMQTEMGIAGTTAKEASTTIQGSIGSMKGAWSNLLTGLADDTQDFDALITNFIDSVGTVAQNLIPRIKIVLGGIVKLIAELVPKLAEMLPPMIKELLPVVIDGIKGILNAIVKMLPDIIDAIMEVIPQLINSLLNALPAIVNALVQIITNVITALGTMLPQIVSAIIEVVPQLVQALIDAIPQLLDAAVQFLLAIVDAIPILIKQLLPQLPKIINTIINGLLKALPQLVKAAIQLFMAIIQAIPEIQSELIKNLPTIIKTIVGGLIKGIPEIIKAGGQLLAGLAKGLLDPKQLAKAVKKLFNGIVGGLKSLFGIHSPSKVMENLIGKNLALGIGVGFEKNIGNVNDMIAEATQIPDVNVNGRGGVKNAGGGVVVYQTNNYAQAHTRNELYKSKQATAAAVRLALAGV